MQNLKGVWLAAGVWPGTCLLRGSHILLRSWDWGESCGAKSWSTWREGRWGVSRGGNSWRTVTVSNRTVKTENVPSATT